MQFALRPSTAQIPCSTPWHLHTYAVSSQAPVSQFWVFQAHCFLSGLESYLDPSYLRAFALRRSLPASLLPLLSEWLTLSHILGLLNVTSPERPSLPIPLIVFISSFFNLYHSPLFDSFITTQFVSPQHIFYLVCKMSDTKLQAP